MTDLKGKYIYIDVWATWCGPCRGELPALKELEEKYAGKDIHFVSLSCDKNKKAWGEHGNKGAVERDPVTHGNRQDLYGCLPH